MNSLLEIAEVLQRSRRVILCGHVMPDGDSLGSVLALGMALEGMGKDVTLASHDAIPEAYNFLPGKERFLLGAQALAGQYDTFVALDCSVPDRLGDLRELLNRPGIVTCNIDHHAGFELYAHFNHVDSSAAATGEIILNLLDLMDIPVSGDIANYLYVSLVTDTGSFQYENTTSRTMRSVARLMDSGVPAAQLNILLFEEKPLANFRVLGAALDTLSLSSCGKVAWISIDRRTLEQLNARDEHADGLINYVRMVRGVEVALLFREVSSKRYKVGLRSKGTVDVNRLAGLFGGGGHSRAAGCIMEGDFEDIKSKIIEVSIAEASSLKESSMKTSRT